MKAKKYLYKFLDKGLLSHYDKSPWELGKWRKVEPPTEECHGLNASEYIQDALGYVQGEVLAKVECGGKIIKGSDKWTCERMRIVATKEWTKEDSVSLAIFSAELCLPEFEKLYPEDNRPRLAIEAAKKWLKTKNYSAVRAADSAVRAVRAAYSEADSAADSAAYSAASAARAADSAVRAADSEADSAVRAADSEADSAASAARAADSAVRAADSEVRAARKKIHSHILATIKWVTK